MNIIIELLNYPFMQRAIVCGIAISLCSALIGVILVLKNYSMIGHGLGEVGFAALSLALVLNLPEMYVAIPIVIIASFIILYFSIEFKFSFSDSNLSLGLYFCEISA